MADVQKAVLYPVKDAGHDGVEYRVYFQDSDGGNVVVGSSMSAENVTLTGYACPEYSDSLAPTDTLMVALGKIERRLIQMEEV